MEVNKKEIEDILKNYAWMMNSIKILYDTMKDAGEGLTAQYGIESSMAKGKGTTGDPIYRETLRREKRRNKLNEYKNKVLMIQERIHVITDERELEILHWLLEGKSYRWIALHMGHSHSHIQRLRISIVDQLVLYVPNVTKDTKLQNEKIVV